MRSVIFTVLRYAPDQRPEECLYQLDIGEDACDLESLALAVSEVLIVLGKSLIQVELVDTVLHCMCICPLAKELLPSLHTLVATNGYTPRNFSVPGHIPVGAMAQGFVARIPVC